MPDQPDRTALQRLGRYVRDDRTLVGYSKLKDFADDLDISAKTIGKLENGTEPVSAETMQAVEDLLNWRRGDSNRVLRDENYRPTVRHPGSAAADVLARTAGDSDGLLAMQLRALYQLLGEAEFVATCLRLGRGVAAPEPSTSGDPTN